MATYHIKVWPRLADERGWNWQLRADKGGPVLSSNGGDIAGAPSESAAMAEAETEARAFDRVKVGTQTYKYTVPEEA